MELEVSGCVVNSVTLKSWSVSYEATAPRKVGRNSTKVEMRGEELGQDSWMILTRLDRVVYRLVVNHGDLPKNVKYSIGEKYPNHISHSMTKA